MPTTPTSRPLLLDSIQIGHPQTSGSPRAADPFEGSWTSAIWKEPVRGRVYVDHAGLRGDQVVDLERHGGPHQAVLMYASTHYPLWREEWDRPDLGPGAFGENLTVTGLTEMITCIGDVFEIGEVRFQVTAARSPCHKLARRHGRRDLVEVVRANHRHGWYLRVEQAGWIEAGMSLRFLDRSWPQWTVERAAEVYWHRAERPQEAALLAACPALHPDWQAKLRR